MTLKFRRFLYITFIILFLIISPLVALYGAGYDFNFRKIRLEKTGTFILDSEPPGARITIKSGINNFNLSAFISSLLNKSGSTYTPFKIKKLAPGGYTVRIEKPDYWPWEKKLSIAPGESTFAENIKLFKIETPVLASEGRVDDAIISNNGSYTLLHRGGDAILADLNSPNSLWPTIKNNLKTAPAWSVDDQKILVGGKIFMLSDVLSDNSAAPVGDLSGFIATSSKKIKWGDDNKIYYLLDKIEKNKKNTTDLIEVDISAGTSRTVFTDKLIFDYQPDGNRLITIEKNGRGASLNIYNRGHYELLRTFNLPDSDYRITGLYGNFLALSDANKNIYIIDPDADAQSVLKNKLDNANGVIRLDNESMIYYSDFEISSLVPASGEKKIITRWSSEIKAVFMIPSHDYIIYATDKNIYALELDGRDRRNLISLAQAENIKFPILNSAGDTMFFYSAINGKKGYFKLKIR